MGINWARPPYTKIMHGVEVTETAATVSGETVLRRTYRTPVGSIYEEEKREPGVGQWHGSRSWKDISPWKTERVIKTPDDYVILKYIVENTEYKADYFPIEQAMDWLGDDGVVMDVTDHSPMQLLMIDWVGSEHGRIFYHLQDYPDIVEDVYSAIAKSHEQLNAIAAKSPAPITLCGDNIDGVLVTPRLFEKYFVPLIEKQAELLHANGKLMAIHMDGRLNTLKELIAKTQIDIVEGFHPPPMGDISLEEALSVWPDKVIWIGFPGSEYTLGPEHVKRYTLDILKEAGTGERLGLAMSTENLVSNENLITLAEVLQQANLPLTTEEIDHFI